MPPKTKITKENIINTAVELVKREGEKSLNARALAAVLGCSTQPIFSNFANMEELYGAILEQAYALYLDFQKKEVESGRYPQYKAFGMAYVRFAKEEKELFKLLFMRDRTGEDISPTFDFEQSAQMIAANNGVTIERARMMHLENWTFVHGIGTMMATSFLPLDFELVSEMLTDIYKGVCFRHLSEETKNGSN